MFQAEIYKKLKYFDLDINLSMNSEVLAVEGESGAGKTTLLDIIAGLRNADRGKITVDDNVLYSSEDEICISAQGRNTGYVFQNYALFPHMNVSENILFGMKCRGIKDKSYAQHLMDIFKISHLKKRFPGEISGGERQRTALVRALVTKPKLLLLDEPFSALDAGTRKTVYGEFLELKSLSNMSIILVTHDKNEAQLLADRSVCLERGKLIL